MKKPYILIFILFYFSLNAEAQHLPKNHSKENTKNNIVELKFIKANHSDHQKNIFAMDGKRLNTKKDSTHNLFKDFFHHNLLKQKDRISDSLNFRAKNKHKKSLYHETITKINKKQVGFVLAVNQNFISVKPIANLSKVIWTGEAIPDLNSVNNYYHIYSISSKNITGLSIGLFGDLKVYKHIYLRLEPNLEFGRTELIYKLGEFSQGDSLLQNRKMTPLTVTKVLYSTNINIPLLIKYDILFKGKRTGYLIAGANYSFDLAHTRTKSDIVHTYYSFPFLKNQKVQLQLGAGYDFYSNAFITWEIEIKFVPGLKNMILRKPDIYSASIDKLYSHMFMLSLIIK